MRSKIVPMRDMMEKFGAQVESFRYAFVLPSHGQGWEGNAFTAPMSPPPAREPVPRGAAAAQPHAPETHPDFRRRAGDKRPVYIEIKPA